MEIDVSQYSSRAKEGKSSWCVDTRSLVNNGKQEFFKTKAEAKAYASTLQPRSTRPARRPGTGRLSSCATATLLTYNKSLTMARSSGLTCWRKNATLDALSN